MARRKMKEENLIERIVHTYSDCIPLDEDFNYEEICWQIANRMIETLDDSQMDSIFGFVFKNAQECFDYIVKKIPGLCERIIEFINENGKDS